MEQLGLKAEWWNTARVVRRVLGHFSHQEILDLSLINKKWNLEARILLKEDGKTLAKLDRVNRHPWHRPGNTCDGLLKFAKMLGSMEVIPFAGFDINVALEHFGSCARLDETWLQMLESIPFRILRITARNSYEGEARSLLARDIHGIDFRRNWERARRICKAVQAVDRLLFASANQLEEISIVAPSTTAFNIRSFANIRGFAQLKLFKLDFHKLVQPNMPLLFDFLKTVVRSAPSLEELSLEDRPEIIFRSWLKQMVSEVLEGSRARLVYYEIGQNLSQIPINCLEHVAVRSIKDPLHWSGNQHLPASLEARRTLLRSSWKTLESAELDIMSISQIIQDGIPFPKLEELKLATNFSFLQECHPALIDVMFHPYAWKRRFPNLKYLTIVSKTFMNACDYGFLTGLMMAQWPQSGSRSLVELENNSGLSLDKLSITGATFALTATNSTFLGSFVGHVKHLIIGQEITGIENVFRYLTSIETLELLNPHPGTETVDDLFCGIHPEEVQELKWNDVEYLKAAHIVPFRPSLLHVKNLKKLIIRMSSGIGRCGFTRVSAGLCFSRIPNLIVNLTVSTSQHEDGPTKIQHFLDVMSDFQEVNTEMETTTELLNDTLMPTQSMFSSLYCAYNF